MATDEETKKSEADETESSEEETDASAQDSTEEASEEETSKGEASSSEDEEDDSDRKKPSKALAKSKDDEAALEAPGEGEALPVAGPAQLGHRRFVYAAYLAAGIGLAFVLTKAVDFAWYKAGMWKPEYFASIGVEPKDEMVVPIASVIAIIVAVRYWRNLKVRTMAEEVAEELTKVTWPSRDEVINSTSVVIVTTIFATVFFALMDQFWLWVTKHVYGS
jgi:preprotein translocase subunit SecE